MFKATRTSVAKRRASFTLSCHSSKFKRFVKSDSMRSRKRGSMSRTKSQYLWLCLIALNSDTIFAKSETKSRCQFTPSYCLFPPQKLLSFCLALQVLVKKLHSLTYCLHELFQLFRCRWSVSHALDDNELNFNTHLFHRFSKFQRLVKGH